MTAHLHIELSMLVAALWFEIDHRDGAAAASFFTPDAELTILGRTARGTAEIDAVYRTRAARGPRVSRHLIANLHVLDHDERHADVLSALVLFAADGESPVPQTTPLLVADVHDRFVRVGGARWLIASRRILDRFLLPDAVLAVPTGEDSTR